jgi:protein-S-isoprenylcysteine O-methyltransferase Ste14
VLDAELLFAHGPIVAAPAASCQVDAGGRARLGRVTRGLRSDDVAVAAQAVTTAALAWPGRGRWTLRPLIRAGAAVVTAAGGVLFVAGLRSQSSQLTPRVTPPAAARLLTDGPYRFSRHPIYAGLLISAAGVAVLRRRLEPLLAWAGLAAVLHVKTGMEERRLHARFGAAYSSYAARTPRLLGLPSGRP